MAILTFVIKYSSKYIYNYLAIFTPSITTTYILSKT